jgi:hypothetical protein
MFYNMTEVRICGHLCRNIKKMRCSRLRAVAAFASAALLLLFATYWPTTRLIWQPRQVLVLAGCSARCLDADSSSWPVARLMPCSTTALTQRFQWDGAALRDPASQLCLGSGGRFGTCGSSTLAVVAESGPLVDAGGAALGCLAEQMSGNDNHLLAMIAPCRDDQCPCRHTWRLVDAAMGPAGVPPPPTCLAPSEKPALSGVLTAAAGETVSWRVLKDAGQGACVGHEGLITCMAAGSSHATWSFNADS